MERKKAFFKRITPGDFYLAGQRHKHNEVFEAYPHQISSNFADIIHRVNEDGSPYVENYVPAEKQQQTPVKEKITVIENKPEAKEKVEETQVVEPTFENKVTAKLRKGIWWDVFDADGNKVNDKALREDKAKELADLLNNQ